MTESQRWKTTGIACVVALSAFLVLRAYLPSTHLATYATIGDSPPRVTLVRSAMRAPIAPPPLPERPPIPLMQSKVQLGTNAHLASTTTDPPDLQDVRPGFLAPTAIPFPSTNSGAVN
jgi:hypothetical protein